ncbi:MAG: bifunctional N(6)-L-threonylcarbamoyladenine synthase/serine/threonine protein kinase [Haloferacaceae archaeon]
MRVLGIEGTAWAASAAVHDTGTDETQIRSDAYQPESGGIHPREASEHMSEAIPAVVEEALDGTDGPIDAVAFSRGPGLGPCLRIAGTAARALAGKLDVPLVGVNHMLAHAEVGRHRSGFADPICLNASGANAHLLGYRDGRYRILGETMDAGVGNAIDKFARHLGWDHPGGPKVEARAREGEYLGLPYVVKGMDFSFAGVSSAAQDAVDDGEAVADVCFGLQETVFASLTEAAERALALTGRDELVLGGGVGQNARLRAMLATMCDERGAAFFAPEPRFLRDNAGMIAVLGAKMAAAGETVSIAESAVDADFRPDEVAVTWWDAPSERSDDGETDAPTRGAEATVAVEGDRVVKTRVAKSYRHPALDERLRRERTRAEARLTSEARRAGVPTPLVRDVDPAEGRIVFGRVGDGDLADALTPERARQMGEHLAALHGAGLVHGDPTTRNARVAADEADRLWLIDFGLGGHSGHVEDHAMDLHVFAGSVAGTAGEDAARAAREAALAGYRAAGDEAVLGRLDAVESRGRYR